MAFQCKGKHIPLSKQHSSDSENTQTAPVLKQHFVPETKHIAKIKKDKGYLNRLNISDTTRQRYY